MLETEPAARLLPTVPGIGPYRGLLLATTLAPVSRVGTPSHFVSYVGPAERPFGERPPIDRRAAFGAGPGGRYCCPNREMDATIPCLDGRV
jgi:hypothetical protein